MSWLTELHQRVVVEPVERWQARRGASLALLDALRVASERQLRPERHGDLARFWAQLGPRPVLPLTDFDLSAAAVRLGRAPDLRGQGDAQGLEGAELERSLHALCPWRKGPFDVFGIRIDAEWRSDMKWGRIASELDLRGAHVLDVGCGNGYYVLRALGAGAASVLGVDPALLPVLQFHALSQFISPAAFVAPLRFEELPFEAAAFDVVLSLGVLGHRRDPLLHLAQLRARVRAGGCVVVETLIVEGQAGDVFVPGGRYAGMSNVHQLPTPGTLLAWLGASGFAAPRLVDVSWTSAEEQRSTEWMPWRSLADVLDPQDLQRTVEGHPAPRRAVVIARA